MTEKQTQLEKTLPLVDADKQLRTVLSNLVNHCVSLGALNGHGNMVLKTNECSSLDPDDRQPWKNILKTYTEDDHYSGENLYLDNNIRLSKEIRCSNRRASHVPSSMQKNRTQAVADSTKHERLARTSTPSCQSPIYLRHLIDSVHLSTELAIGPKPAIAIISTAVTFHTIDILAIRSILVHTQSCETLHSSSLTIVQLSLVRLVAGRYVAAREKMAQTKPPLLKFLHQALIPARLRLIETLASSVVSYWSRVRVSS